MIVFVPAYDEATRANHAVASELPGGTCSLLGTGATREALLGALEQHAVSVFAMAHGKPERLRGHDGAAAIEATDAPALAGRCVFAFACHTSASLGRDLASHGVTWWGYIKEVTAPDPRDVFRRLFVDIFSWIFHAFDGAGSHEERRAALVHLQRMCDEAAHVVDQAAEADPLLDVMETVQSLRDIWQLLHIWPAHAEVAQSHPYAPPVVSRHGL